MLRTFGLIRFVETAGEVGGGFGEFFINVLQLNAAAALLRFIELLEVFLQRLGLRHECALLFLPLGTLVSIAIRGQGGFGEQFGLALKLLRFFGGDLGSVFGGKGTQGVGDEIGIR